MLGSPEGTRFPRLIAPTQEREWWPLLNFLTPVAGQSHTWLKSQPVNRKGTGFPKRLSWPPSFSGAEVGRGAQQRALWQSFLSCAGRSPLLIALGFFLLLFFSFLSSFSA